MKKNLISDSCDSGGGVGVVVNPAATPISLWVVDDNRRIRDTLVELFGRCQGIRCTAAFHSPNAVLSALASKVGPDVILLDMNLGEHNGIDAIRAIRRLAPRLSVDPTVLRLLVEGGRGVTGSVVGGLAGTVAQPIVVNKGLHFRLHKVKCIDETNPEWPGDDEIAMGGTAVPPTGNPTKVPEFMVRDDFDDGESKTYSPPRVLKTFALDNVSYPADFLMVLAMAEKDNGGLSQFLQDLWEAIKDEVGVIVAAVGAAAGLAIGGAIGGTVGTAIGGPLGTIIGAVAGAILGALVGWLISAVKDDIFTPQSAAVHLPKPNSTFAGGALTSPQFSLDFRDHGGHYRAYYTWQLVR